MLAAQDALKCHHRDDASPHWDTNRLILGRQLNTEGVGIKQLPRPSFHQNY